MEEIAEIWGLFCGGGGERGGVESSCYNTQPHLLQNTIYSSVTRSVLIDHLVFF